MNEARWGADREIPIGRYAKKASCVDENRVHVPKDVQQEVDPRGDLKCPLEAVRGSTPMANQVEARDWGGSCATSLT